MNESISFTYEILDGVELVKAHTAIIYDPEKVSDYGISTKRIYRLGSRSTCDVEARWIVYQGVEYGSWSLLNQDLSYSPPACGFRFFDIDFFDSEFE